MFPGLELLTKYPWLPVWVRPGTEATKRVCVLRCNVAGHPSLLVVTPPEETADVLAVLELSRGARPLSLAFGLDRENASGIGSPK